MAASSKHSARQVLLRLSFTLYCLLMLWLLFGQRWGTSVYTQQLAQSINLTPFATVGRYLSILRSSENPAMLRHAVINLAGNVVMFIPLGFFLPGIWRVFRGFLRTFLTALIWIAAVELVQYASMLGTCDIDDLILNMAGVCIGYLFYKIKPH